MRACAAFTPIPCRSTPIAAPGGPEAAYVLERLVDQCARGARARRRRRSAREISSSRRRCPIRRRPSRTYDVGDFEGALRACLAKADYAGFAARAEASRKRGLDPRRRHRQLHRMHGLGRRREGFASCSRRTGDFTVLIGTQSNGQGHETAYAQVVSQYLDVPLDRASKSCRATPIASRPGAARAARARSRSAR